MDRAWAQQWLASGELDCTADEYDGLVLMALWAPVCDVMIRQLRVQLSSRACLEKNGLNRQFSPLLVEQLLQLCRGMECTQADTPWWAWDDENKSERALKTLLFVNRLLLQAGVPTNGRTPPVLRVYRHGTRVRAIADELATGEPHTDVSQQLEYALHVANTLAPALDGECAGVSVLYSTRPTSLSSVLQMRCGGSV